MYKNIIKREREGKTHSVRSSPPSLFFLSLYKNIVKREREGKNTFGSIIHKFPLLQQEEVKETKQESGGESPAETAEVTTPTEASTPNTATSPDNKETKKKEKVRYIHIYLTINNNLLYKSDAIDSVLCNAKEREGK